MFPGRRDFSKVRIILPLFTTLLLLSLVLAGPVSAQFTEFEAAIAKFDAEVAAGVAEDAAGCVSIAVFIGNDVVWAKGYGWADIENRIAATEETIGRIGSISKSFTAVAMVQLVERGIFGFDDPVADYFPEIKGIVDTIGVDQPITFRMLASHTSGLIREPRLRGAASGSIYFWEDKILESIPTTFFFAPPLTKYQYSNIGFGILGLASSRAANVPFMELVTENIFKPLGMTSSTFILNSPELWARMSVGYNRTRSGVSAAAATREHFGRGYKVPNGGIYSTVLDLAKFAAAIMGESPVKILSTESLAEITTPQPPAGGYGLGFSLGERGGLKTVGHGGSVAGYNANLSFNPDTKIGVAMLRTTGYNPDTGTLLRELVAAYKN
ncbi:serine hydrolase domain-containing protein [candidate division KSB1 bacterium]